MADLEIKTTTKIAEACATQHSHFNIAHVRATPNSEGVWLDATDGSILAAVKCDGQTDAQRLLPPEAWKDQHKTGRHVITANGDRWETNRGRFGACQPTRLFPRTDDIVPKAEGTMIALDVKKLMQAATAIGEDVVTLWITKWNKPVAIAGRTGFAVIMPYDPEDREGEAYEAMRTDYIQSMEHAREAQADRARRE